MPPSKFLKPSIVVATIGLFFASAYCEVILTQTEKVLFQSHQARWNCLSEESSKAPRCKELAKLKPFDADYCAEAVAVCRKRGMYEEVANAEASYSMWQKLAVSLRLVWLTTVISSLAWGGLVRPIRSWFRSRPAAPR